jgi:hypothetical protein
MTFDRVSRSKGAENWFNAIVHDDGNSFIGGQSLCAFGAPGAGKTTLMLHAAQECCYMKSGGKAPFVHALVANEGQADASNTYLETVIYRVRDLDGLPNIFPEHWKKNLELTGLSGNPVKECVIFVHEDDIADVVFFSFDKHQAREIPCMPEIIPYHDTTDIMGKLRRGAINAVLEPQHYRLSDILIRRLQERKMEEIDENPDDGEIHPTTVKDRKTSRHQRKQREDYKKKAVGSSVFWFDMILACKLQNKRKFVTIHIDEFDDVTQARNEGLLWALCECLSSDFKDLRKAGVSLLLSTHQFSYIDWRIIRRLNYVVLMRGAEVNKNYSMVDVQRLISDLPQGRFICENRKISFGLCGFNKIANKQHELRIEGLRGQPRLLDARERTALNRTVMSAVA